MSSRIFKIEKLKKIYITLSEGVDLHSVKPIDLLPKKRVTFTHNNNTFGMVLEPYNKNMEKYLPPLLKDNLEGYYNFGFDLEGITIQSKKQSYKDLAKPLATISKSLLEWVSKNKPQLVTIYADGDNKIEQNKKLTLYTSILDRETPLLNSIGYTWDFANSPILGKIIIIKQK